MLWEQVKIDITFFFLSSRLCTHASTHSVVTLMRVLDIVIDFLASVLETVLQNVMALTGDSPQTPETAPTWVNVETFSAVGELLDRHAGQFSHALLKVNSQCSAPMAAISCFSLPFTAALKKKVERPAPDAWMLKRNIHKVPNANDSVTLSLAGKRYTSQSRERQKLSVESPVSSSGHKQAVVLDSRNDWWTVFFDEQIAKVSTRQGFHVHEDAQASSISWSITIGSAAAGRDHVSSPFARTSHGFNAVFT